MKSRSYLLPALAGFGLLAGLGAGRLAGGSGTVGNPLPPQAEAKDNRNGSKGGTGGGSHKEPKLTLVKPAALPKSADTVESLLKLNRGPLYSRLGLWLLDASEADMAAFWQGYHNREDPNDTIKDLLFTQWGKKNAPGMLAAAKSTGHEVSSMWSWAMSDPQGMLAFIDGKSYMMRNYGLRGLAYFHPELAQEMLEQDPKLKETFQLYEMAEQLSGGDPKKEIEFFARFPGNEYLYRSALKRWAAQDPHQAFEWLSQRGGTDDYSLRKEFLESLKEEQPEVLAELSAGLPSGSQRRELEAVAFAHLAETDPEKAAEEARQIEVPRLAAERFALLGKAMVADQPEQALALLRELFEKCPDASTRKNWVTYPDGGGSGGLGVTGVPEFLNELAGWDPKQTLATILDIESQNSAGLNQPQFYGHDRGSEQVAKQWARRDLEGLSSWVESQDDAALRDMGAGAICNELQVQRDYQTAVEWAAQMSNENRQQNALASTISSWVQQDREAARQWFEQADLPEQTRQNLQAYFPRTNP